MIKVANNLALGKSRTPGRIKRFGCGRSSLRRKLWESGTQSGQLPRLSYRCRGSHRYGNTDGSFFDGSATTPASIHGGQVDLGTSANISSNRRLPSDRLKDYAFQLHRYRVIRLSAYARRYVRVQLSNSAAPTT